MQARGRLRHSCNASDGWENWENGRIGRIGRRGDGELGAARFFWKNIPKIMGQNPKHFWTKFRKLFGQKARDFCSKNVLSYSVYDGTVVNGITEELFWTKIPRHFCQKTRGNFQEKGGENLNKKWGKTCSIFGHVLRFLA